MFPNRKVMYFDLKKQYRYCAAMLMNPPSSALPQATLDSIQNPFAIKSQCGVILSCNQAFKDLNSLGTTNLVGLTAHDFLPQKEADIHTQSDMALMSSDDRRLDYYIARTKSDGSKLSLYVHKSLSQNEQGEPEILVVINKTMQSHNAHNNFLLSPRESSVLELLVRGNSQKQIAIALGISHHTVADYLKAIYTKLGVNSRTQAQLKGILDLGLR